MTTKSFGPWVFDTENYTLECDGYDIDLEQIETSSQMLDWICQISNKSYATPEMLGHLVLALNWIFQPQANLCGSGIPKRIAAPAFLKEFHPHKA